MGRHVRGDRPGRGEKNAVAQALRSAPPGGTPGLHGVAGNQPGRHCSLPGTVPGRESIVRTGRGGAQERRHSFSAMKTYSISRLARACGLSRSTLLYYDRLGLLKPTGRTGSGYRYYTDADQRRLERIGHFRQAGLTLKEIRAVLSSGGKPGTRLLET